MSYSGSFRFQRYDVNKTIKNIRFYGYSGGMVSQAHPEKLNDGQSALIENADVIAGGTLVNRGAYSQLSKCDSITVTTLDEIRLSGFTMQSLTNYTMAQLNAGLTTPNVDTSEYYNTMDGLKNDGITMDYLKDYTMDTIKNKGVTGMEVGDTQGIFRYHNTNGQHTDILAIKGKLYTVQNNSVYKPLIISGLDNFQTLRPIEAVQYRDKLYIATGSGIVIYDGTTASAMTAYQPNGLEVLYIGNNAYAADPDNFMQDTTGASDTLNGITVDQRYGLVNNNVLFTAYVSKISTDILEYLFETKLVTDTTYATAQNWSTAKTLTTAFTSANDYMVRVSIRVQGTTPVLSQYVLPKYTIKSTYDTTITPSVNFSNISTCNRIFVHYDQLCVYGDTTNPDFLYMSHVNNFTFFPRTNIITVADPFRGQLQAVTRFKNFLVCFTDGSIQQITGTDPTTYALVPIHMSLGTAHPYSVQVMQNYVAFVGNDNGVYILKTFNYAANSDKMNVQRLDNDIKNLIMGDIANAQRILSCIWNDQYYLYIQTETNNYVYRFYYLMGIWVRDNVSISFKIMNVIDNAITLGSVYNGLVYQLKKNVYFDGVNTVFNMHILSKDYDMNMPHHRKKLKQFQLLAELTALTTMSISIYGDNKLLTVQSISHDPVQNSDADKLKVTTSGAFRYVKVDIQIPITENVQLLGYAFIFKLNTPK